MSQPLPECAGRAAVPPLYIYTHLCALLYQPHHGCLHTLAPLPPFAPNGTTEHPGTKGAVSRSVECHPACRSRGSACGRGLIAGACVQEQARLTNLAAVNIDRITVSEDNSDSSAGGLSSAAIGGIVVALILVLLVLAAVALLVRRHRRNSKNKSAGAGDAYGGNAVRHLARPCLLPFHTPASAWILPAPACSIANARLPSPCGQWKLWGGSSLFASPQSSST